MDIVSIAQARSFSLQEVQRRPLVQGELEVELRCFEAGQQDRDETPSSARIYQVLEGELLVRLENGHSRLGKGRVAHLPSGVKHRLENAGGGLLVVMVTQQRARD